MQKTAFCNRISHAFRRRFPNTQSARKRRGMRSMTKTFLVMKLTFLFITLGLLQVHAKGLAQQITYAGDKVKLTDIFQVIKKQTGYFVISDKALLENARPVSVKAVNQPLELFVRTILEGQSISFTIEGNTIVLSPQVPVPDKVSVAATPPQPPPVTGRVTNADGLPLQGVSIKIKGTNIGVSTDAGGKFSINATAGQTLVFTYINMMQQEIKIKDATTELRIAMVVSAAKMEEFVVTGYSNVRKESFTGNATRIDREQILKVGNRNVLEILQVFDPSYRLEKNNIAGSDPNKVPDFYIRGRSGIGVKELDNTDLSKAALTNNPNLPIFIMDGYEVPASKVYDYDPNRIKSITILKDAAATAVYGSRAANGVIVIETVAPIAGKLSVSYNLVTTLTAPDLSDYNLMNAAEKLEAERLGGYYKTDGLAGNAAYVLVDEYIRKKAKVDKGVNTDWISQPLTNEFNQKHTLYVEGGSDQVRYGFLMRYDKQNGVMKGSGRERIGTGITLDYRGKHFQVRDDITYDVVKSTNSPYGSFSDYTWKAPYDEIYDANGIPVKNTTTWHSGVTAALNLVNPLYEALMTKNFSKSGYQTLTNNLSLNWNIAPHLQLRGQLAVSKTDNNSDDFIDPSSGRYNITGTTDYSDIGQLSLTASSNISVNTNLFTNYVNSIHGHNINFSFGINTREMKTDGSSMTYTGFPSGSQSSPNFASKLVSKPAYSDNHTRMFGSFLALNYSYRDIYLLDLSGRLDGSSEFGSEKKYAPFWSVGTGINLHKYDFLKNNKIISRARITANMGQLGKTNFQPYAAKDTYTRSTDWYRTGVGANLLYMGNTSLNWETTNTYDLIFDMGFLKDRIFLNVDLYNKVTKDLVNDVDLPLSSGFPVYKDNIGKIRNRGIEISVRGDVIRTKDVLVAVFGTFAHNENVLLDISQSLQRYNELVNAQYNGYLGASSSNNPAGQVKFYTPHVKYVEGGSVTSIFGMKSLGINPMDGKEIFQKPDGTITYDWNAADQVIIGDPTPKGQGSFGLNVNYKGWSLFGTFLYEYGGQQYNYTLLTKVENVDIYNRNADKRVLTQRWIKPGDVTMLKNIAEGTWTTLPTSRFMQDYNSISLNSLSLGYTFKKELVKKLGLGMLRMQLSTNNVATLSTVKQERGLSYPFARTFDFSLNLAL